MKKKYGICIILIISSLLLANSPSLVLAYPLLAVGKYCCSVLAISYTTYVVLECLHIPRIKNRIGRQISLFVTMILFLSYFILTLDTFLFHVLTWYPGIMRYAIFDAYGIVYLIFILPGILWYLGDDFEIAK